MSSHEPDPPRRSLLRRLFGRDRDANLRNALRKCIYPAFIFDQHTLRFVEVNDAALQRYGYTRAGFLARTALDIRPPEEIREFLRTAVHHPSSKVDPEQHRHMTRSGNSFLVEIRSRRTVYKGQRVEVVCAIPAGDAPTADVSDLLDLCEAI